MLLILFKSAGSTDIPVGRADEIDAALALARVKIAAAGLATETDAALALARVKLRAFGMATETDTALAPTTSSVREFVPRLLLLGVG